MKPSDLKEIDRDDPQAKTDAHDKETQFKTQAHSEFVQGDKPDLFVTSDIRSEIKSALSTLKSQEKVEEASLASVHAQTTDKAFRAAARGEITTAEAEAIIAEGNMRDSAVRRTSHDTDLQGNLAQPENGTAAENPLAQDVRDPMATAGVQPEGPRGIANAEAIRIEQQEGLLVEGRQTPLTVPGAEEALEAAPQTREQELATSLRGIIQDIGMFEEQREAELVEVPRAHSNNLSEKQAAAIDLRAYGREAEQERGLEIAVAEEKPIELNLEGAELEAVSLETGNRLEERLTAEAVVEERVDAAASIRAGAGEETRIAVELENETELEKVKVVETAEANRAYEAVDLDVDFGRVAGVATSAGPSTKDIANEMRAKLEVDTRQQEDIDRETLDALDKYFERQELEPAPVTTREEPRTVAEPLQQTSVDQGRVEFDFGAKPAQPSMSFVVREDRAPAATPEQKATGDFRASVAASGELAALEAKVREREVKLEDDTLNINFSMNA